MPTTNRENRLPPPPKGGGIHAAAFKLRYCRTTSRSARFNVLLLLLPTLLILVALLSACDEEEQPAATATPTATPASTSEATLAPASLTFMAGFKPQANLPFMGAYVAQEKGFFQEQGLTVKIEHSRTSGEEFRFLAVGEVQITTADASVVLERRSGDPAVPLVAVALIGQTGQQGFAVLADSGIQTPKDWEGKTFGYKGSQPTPDYLAIVDTEGVDRGKIQEVRVGYEPQVLTEKTVDILAVFLSNEPDTLERLGYHVRTFDPADYGVPTLGLTYVTSESYLQEHPDIVQRFLKAVLHGIYYAKDNPDEAIDIVLKYAPEEQREHQRFMFETELAAALTGAAQENGIGWMTAAQWQALYDMLERYQALSGPLADLSAAYSTTALEAIYKNGELQWP
jgi:ABC-type nitrate/sulfonate/bicarbonate transport system substrate-binding protein